MTTIMETTPSWKTWPEAQEMAAEGASADVGSVDTEVVDIEVVDTEVVNTEVVDTEVVETVVVETAIHDVRYRRTDPATSSQTPIPTSTEVAATPDQDGRSLPAVFTQRPRLIQRNLDYIGLKRLMVEEEQLAFRAVTHGLTTSGQQRLTAIEDELDRRWALFG